MGGGWAEGVTIAGAGLLAVWTTRAWLRMRGRARLIAVARDVTARHARLLAVKQKQLVVHDGYGNYQLQPWIDHVDYFIEKVILREAKARGLSVDDAREGTATRRRLTQALLATLHAGEPAIPLPIGDDGIISGEHYETLCRNLLQAEGWRVDTTPVTGDQGADLIADAGGCRVVIQCKYYSKPVGNKAVQEAHAAVAFHAGDRAAVVSNATFTRSAQQLAQASGVMLLHHDQLPDLGRMIRAEARR